MNDSTDQPQVPAVEMQDSAETAHAAGGSSEPKSPTARYILIGVTAAVVVAVLAFVGLHVGGSNAKSTSSTSASSAGGGSNGGGNGFPAGGFRGGGNRGTITAIDGSTITMKSANAANVTVKTTSSTKVSAVVNSSVSKIANGDRVIVMGTTSGSTVAATRVIDNGASGATDPSGGGAPGGFGGPPNGAAPNGEIPSGGAPPQGGFGNGAPPQGAPGGGQGNFSGFPTIGTVKSIDGSTFTVETGQGSTVTVTTNGATKFTTTETSSLSALKVGETISVQTGARPSNGAAQSTTITATSITEGDLGFGR